MCLVLLLWYKRVAAGVLSCADLQVLDEIGIDTASQLQSAPRRPVAARVQNRVAEDDELAKALAALR